MFRRKPEEEVPAGRSCPLCGHVNAPDAASCVQCHTALSAMAAQPISMADATKSSPLFELMQDDALDGLSDETVVDWSDATLSMEQTVEVGRYGDDEGVTTEDPLLRASSTPAAPGPGVPPAVGPGATSAPASAAPAPAAQPAADVDDGDWEMPVLTPPSMPQRRPWGQPPLAEHPEVPDRLARVGGIRPPTPLPGHGPPPPSAAAVAEAAQAVALAAPVTEGSGGIPSGGAVAAMLAQAAHPATEVPVAAPAAAPPAAGPGATAASTGTPTDAYVLPPLDILAAGPAQSATPAEPAAAAVDPTLAALMPPVTAAPAEAAAPTAEPQMSLSGAWPSPAAGGADPSTAPAPVPTSSVVDLSAQVTPEPAQPAAAPAPTAPEVIQPPPEPGSEVEPMAPEVLLPDELEDGSLVEGETEGKAQVQDRLARERARMADARARMEARIQGTMKSAGLTTDEEVEAEGAWAEDDSGGTDWSLDEPAGPPGPGQRGPPVRGGPPGHAEPQASWDGPSWVWEQIGLWDLGEQLCEAQDQARLGGHPGRGSVAGEHRTLSRRAPRPPLPRGRAHAATRPSRGTADHVRWSSAEVAG